MTTTLKIVQQWLLFALAVGTLLTQIVALVDAIRQPGDLYHAAGKLAKPQWIIILVIAVALGLARFPDALGTFNVIAFVAAAVYLVDVRPALRRLKGGPGGLSGPPW
ncbi:MAG: DUF2516 family protein [Angustibacter sp.]